MQPMLHALGRLIHNEKFVLASLYKLLLQA